MSTTILIIDDDAKLNKLLTEFLGDFGFSTLSATHPKDGLKKLKHQSPDLVILDVMLPGMDGFEVCRTIRQNSSVPIIMLTARGELMDKVVGLELGADDYIVKPYDNRELLARIKSVLRRIKLSQQASHIPPKDSGQVAHFDGWTFDLSGHDLVSPEGNNINLTSYEYKLLSALILSKNRVLSRDHLMDLIAEREWNPDDRSIDVLIGKLRKKLEKDRSTPVLIKTMRGAGYKFTAQVSLSSPSE